MAIRRPLVILGGQLQELPAGDTLPGGGGGGRTVESATIALPHQSRSHTAVVSRPGTLNTQVCQAWLAATADSDDNSPELLEGVNIEGVCETDQIRLFWRSSYAESGNVKLNYEVI